MSIYEILAVGTGLISVILTIYKSYYSWVIGLVSIFLYAYVFYFQSLFVNTGLQFIFAIQSVHGLWYWTRNRKRRGEDVTISMYKFDISKLMFFLFYVVMINIVLSYFFPSKLDCITGTLSLIATYWLVIGKIENWVLWMITDLLYVIMFIQNGLYLSAVLYFIFFLLCIKGFIDWLKVLNISVGDYIRTYTSLNFSK